MGTIETAQIPLARRPPEVNRNVGWFTNFSTHIMGYTFSKYYTYYNLWRQVGKYLWVLVQ
jgi:hypothetical protein